jgi:prepilin peptidase CpaA
LVFSLGGLAVGGGILIFYLMGALGAGDVKLMGSVGAFLGAENSDGINSTVFIGGLMALWKLVLNSSFGKIISRFRRFASDFTWKAHFASEAMNINPKGYHSVRSGYCHWNSHHTDTMKTEVDS